MATNTEVKKDTKATQANGHETVFVDEFVDGVLDPN